ncbi:MAG: HIT family protein [Halobacteriales archaeon]|nr:HIT family protein [Halobacteriales archaeon]
MSGAGNAECVFCQIRNGESVGSFVYRDDTVFAIMTTGPVNPGHVLVIPNAHLAYLSEMDETTGGHLFTIAMRLARAIRESGLRCEGINLFYADGEAAFQEVFHAHLHVFPRFEGDPFELHADWEVNPSRGELDDHAERIQRAYEEQYPARAETTERNK